MSYEVYCPITIPRRNNKLIESDKKELTKFWDNINTKYGFNLSDGIGCYIFSISAGGGNKPLYIGMTKSAFKNECFTDHKLKHYNNSIAGRTGVPNFTFIVKMSGKKNDRLAKSRVIVEKIKGGKIKSRLDKEAHKDIDLLETLLIGSCLKRNPDLANVSETTIFKDLIVPGFINNPTGRNSDAINEFIHIVGA
jgi:hypothetical protein